MTWDDPAQTIQPEAKQRIGTRFYAPSASGLCGSSPCASLNFSSTELQRVLDSLLDQVAWLEVAVKDAKKRAPSVYCNAIEKILLVHIYQLVKAKGEIEELGKFENGNDGKELMCVSEGDDGDDGEVGRNSEADGGCDRDVDNSEDMQEFKEESSCGYKDDEMDEHKYSEGSEWDYAKEVKY